MRPEAMDTCLCIGVAEDGVPVKRHPLLRSGLPVGLLGVAGPRGAAAGATATAWRGGWSSIGLTEQAEQYVRRGYTPGSSARGYLRFRARGMPFATQPRARVAGTGLACRAIVATRLLSPECEIPAFRALQFGWFTTPLVLDDPDDLAAALARVDGLDVAAVLGALDSPEVEAAYQADRAEARTAAGSPTEAQGKAAQTDGPVRYTAPSLVFERDGRRLRGRRLPAGRGLRRR